VRSSESDDYISGSIQLLEHLYFGGLVEYKTEYERDFSLDKTKQRDVWKNRLSTRLQFLWTPSESVTLLFTPRLEGSYRWSEAFADTRDLTTDVNEAWIQVRNVAFEGLDLRLGRQEFADNREWLYKRNLDALRMTWQFDSIVVDASASTPMQSDSVEFNEHADTYMLSATYGETTRNVSAYLIDRRDDRSPKNYPLYMGARAFGDWIPGAKSWAEASLVRGYDDDLNIRGHGFDVGTSWRLPFANSVYAIAGYAYGSGDDASSTSTDESFRQTGLQKNNGKLGGVTSYRYYGEIVDPELSNLEILTLGVGTRINRMNSIDLVWHSYDQAEAASFLRQSNLRPDPDGVHTNIGHEIDLVLGTRAVENWEFELVFGWFGPGSAFPGADEAWLAAFQLKFRF